MMQTSTSGDLPERYGKELMRGMRWRVMASILAIGAILGAMWASYGMRQAELTGSRP